MAKTKPKPQEVQKAFDFYKKKVEEYNSKTLEELKAFYLENQKKIGGMNERALFDVVNTKLQELKDKTIADQINEQKEKESKEAEESHKGDQKGT